MRPPMMVLSGWRGSLTLSVRALWSHNCLPLSGCALIIKVLRRGTGDLFDTGRANSAPPDRRAIFAADVIPWHRSGRTAALGWRAGRDRRLRRNWVGAGWTAGAGGRR